MTNAALKHRWWKRFRKGGEGGQALVELAFCALLLIPMLLGAVEFARFAYLAIEMSRAAKAAAQYGAQNAITASDTQGMTAAAAVDAPEAGSKCTNFTTTIASPCECRSGGSATPTTCGSTCASGTYSVQHLTITTSAQCAPLIYPSGFGGTLTLSGHAVQEVMN